MIFGAKISHELTHLDQQGTSLVICIAWVFLYLFSRQFRKNAESAAFLHELKYLILNGVEIDQDMKKKYVNSMLRDYFYAFNREEAEALVDSAKQLYRARR